MEAERSVAGKPFALSPEQQTALSVNGGLVVILGNSGAGKTTMMEAIRRDAHAAGRPIRGVTIAQAAAIRLEVQAGFGAVNTAFALLADNPRRELIPRNGVLVIDEAAMVDSRTMRALLRLARERNTNVVAIGDPRQIQAVGAGGCWAILQAAAREAGTFAELTQKRRQIHDWHQRAVALTSRAIEREDEPTVRTRRATP
jgi:ATP-dependent exoDNAse (exonuclease V) alpha subunit